MTTASVLPPTLEKADGTTVAVEELNGKIVVLFFSSEWCPACKRFLPTLKTLYETAEEEGKPLEIVYVSSDRSAQQKTQYFKSHGGWLSVAFDDEPARNALKARYGCFAGAESGSFPGTKRRAGIPSIVVIGPNGEERVHMDCDPSTEINQKGEGVLDDWLPHAWPVNLA